MPVFSAPRMQTLAGDPLLRHLLGRLGWLLTGPAGLSAPDP
ncbi:MAG: hypothetical protein RMK65_08930 [Anaerolineae bacterium]|nr:hypothetical protein [Anaerolineae bacterium]